MRDAIRPGMMRALMRRNKFLMLTEVGAYTRSRLELNLSNIRTHSRVDFGYTLDRGAQVELKSERV